MKKRKDTDIIQLIRSDNQADRQEAMLYLYQRLFEKVSGYVVKNSGSSEEAKDIFQDSLFALLKHARNDNLGPAIKLEAYFFTICKNLWLKELNKKKRTVALTPKYENISGDDKIESKLIREERDRLVDQLIAKVGASCYQILKYYYYDKKRMKEIAKLMQLSSEQAAKDKKASCMKKLRLLVREHAHLLKLLK